MAELTDETVQAIVSAVNALPHALPNNVYAQRVQKQWVQPPPIMDVANQRLGVFDVEFYPSYRFGMVTAEDYKPVRLTMSEQTYEALCKLEAAQTALVPGQPWYDVADVLEKAINDAEQEMRTVLVDLSAQLKKPPRKAPAVKRPTDKLDEVCAGISQLVAKMSGYTCKDGRHADDTVLMEFAQEYGRLRDRMRVLRTAMEEADGQFDIAQQQMVHLMEGR